MTVRNLTRYEKQQRNIPIPVFFTGSGALTEGDALCYDLDRGTAANVDNQRTIFVEAPTVTNNLAFAGVVAQARSAQTGGQWVDIYLPGSTCLVNVLQTTTTIGYGRRLNFCAASNTAANVGLWRTGGLPGLGSGRILQTLSAAGLCLVELETGPQSGGIQELLPVTGAAAAAMVGGTTAIQAVTIASNSTDTLADATMNGLKKLIFMDGLITTSDWVLTVTSGIQLDGTTSLASLTFDAATEYALLEWNVSEWHVVQILGATQG